MKKCSLRLRKYWVSDMDNEETLSFTVCPICGGFLETGRLKARTGYRYEMKMDWCPDEPDNYLSSDDEEVSVLFTEHTQPIQHLGSLNVVYGPVDKLKPVVDFELPLTAGYCPVCQKVFAGLDVTMTGKVMI